MFAFLYTKNIRFWFSFSATIHNVTNILCVVSDVVCQILDLKKLVGNNLLEAEVKLICGHTWL